MALRKTGELSDSLGREAEERVLASIFKIFGNDYARVFVNKSIPGQFKTPDFVLPVLDRENKFHFLIIECKAAPRVNVDGSTKHVETFEQITHYKELIEKTLGAYNKSESVICYVVHPNLKERPGPLKNGRNGVLWMDLAEFEARLLSFKPVGPKHPCYESVQLVYSRAEILQKYRSKIILSEEQKKIANWPFGGTKKIGGLAGTGKSLLLAKKLINDIQNSEGSSFLYLTHNKNLILKFKEYIQGFLEELEIKSSFQNDRNPAVISFQSNGRRVEIILCTFDAFSTACFIRRIDTCLFQSPNGPLKEISKRCRGDRPQTKEFRQEREELYQYLLPHSSKEKIFQVYDALYIDEFQDCRIDPSRLKLASFFVKRNSEGELNLTFSEDTLQSFVKYDILKELDDSYESIHRKDFANYEALGLPPGLRGKVTILDTIYRTPESIFKASLNLLENQGGLLKGRRDKIKHLTYKNISGSWSHIDQDHFLDSVHDIMNSKQKFPHEIIIIESMERDYKSKIQHALMGRLPFHKVSNMNPPQDNIINLYHEFNVRGLESKVVYLIIDEEMMKNPNYVYTLMCRTEVELILVRGVEVLRDKFNKFVALMRKEEMA